MSDKGAEVNPRRAHSSCSTNDRQRLHSETSQSRGRHMRGIERRSLSRSRSDYGERRLRLQRPRGRSSGRDQRRSVYSTRTLREQERKLSREREKLRTLEKKVRKKRERWNERNRSSRRVETPDPTPDWINTDNLRTHRDRSVSTAAKGRVTSDDSDNVNNVKKPKLITMDVFEDCIKLFKSKAGDRESFSSSTLNNIIPEYDPMLKEQTINNWLDKVDECSEIYDWSDKQTIHYALPKLTGLAKMWYQGLPSIKHTWPQWKIMLKESFPSTENYAELLTNMLDRRVRSGESFEIYYFAKLNLLNRCKIIGRQAVDCLLYGIDDRGVRVGAQAAKFSKPEDVLEFFKTIKCQTRSQPDSYKDFNKDKRTSVTKVNNNSTRNSDSTYSRKSVRGPVTCFNCQGVGHPSFKCPKPIIKCTNCYFLGHDSSHCPKLKDQKNPSKDKSVLEVSVTENSNNKYKMMIIVNGISTVCQLDLGSEATLIRKTNAVSLGLKWEGVNSPYLRGLGNVPYLPLGCTLANITVQGISEKDVEVFIVDDHLINCDVLLGHSFTERPSLKIIKTPLEIRFERVGHEFTKLHLYTICDLTVDIGMMVSIPVRSKFVCQDSNIYVGGSIRGREGQEYYLLPGEYQIRNSECNLLVQNVGTNTVYFKRDTLITRAQIVGSGNNDLNILKISNDFNNHDPITPKCGNQLSDTHKRQIVELLEKYKDCFSTGMHDLGFTNVTEMEIHLKDSTPVVYRPYRLPHSERKLVQNMVGEMIEHGIVRESNSPYASPIVLVKKKSGEKRLCVDYRALNSRTKRDHYPLPRIDDLLDQLSGQSLFTSLDLASGYHQIAIAEQSREKTAFVTPDGQYEYNRVPFGLANAPAVFQRAIHKILNKTKIGYIVIYMDDILIPSKSFKEGLERLGEVLGILREAGLTLKMEKCNFFQERIDFLGFEINKDGIRPGAQKIEAVSRFPIPRNQHEVRRFLGLASFFRRFVKGFALIARPLTNLLKKDIPWKWGDAQTNSFETIKRFLTERPVLALYNPDAETQLHTDASKFGIAGILLQRKDSDPWRPVAYFSRQTLADEMKMHSFELETLAVISSLNKFRTYLIGIKFTIVTDCNALRSTFTKRDLIPRISRWWIQFLEFDCEIEYRPGERMSHVDALSRGPVSPPAEEINILDIMSVSTEDWISTVQSSDDEVKRIKDVLEDPETSKIASIYKDYTIKNGRVFRILKDGATRWMVPKGVRWQLLKINHDDVGHFGFEKTLERIRSLFWFPKMRKFIKKYVAACLECAHHKLPSGTKEGFLHPIPKVDIPFHTLHADHLGPFPRSKRGNTYILVMVDGFTKYVNLSPVRSTKTKESIKAFKTLFSYFGAPSRLITDRGTSFTSKKFKTFVQSIGAKHILNSVATPRANGQVERYNRTILASLGSMAHGKNKNMWDELLHDIQLGLNTTIHDVTKKTPTELLLGRTVTNPNQGILNKIIEDIEQSNSETLEEVRFKASERIKKNQAANKSRFDKHRKKCAEYKEGDLVRIARAIVAAPGQSKKLEAKCQGPYRIKKILPNDRFLVEDTPLTRKGAKYETIVAVDKIFPWLSFNISACPSSEDSDSESNNNFNKD
ncbi:unnamed protein product [Parnassius mnemosyne]|uniref:RNA-directed DNA polymerase n=1 Tax=Parnassius mnemosyne TaxID=213953 RepID=A0AAV1LRL0_9NEOP